MKLIHYLMLTFLIIALLIVPGVAIPEGTATRSIAWFYKFWNDQYNSNLVMFGFWCTLCTALWGLLLGLITDRIMKLTGLDLTSRDVAEN
jgi:hypothetical protein